MGAANFHHVLLLSIRIYGMCSKFCLFIYLAKCSCELAACFAFPSTSVSEGSQLVAGERLKPLQTMARWSGDGHTTCLKQTLGAWSFQPNLPAQFTFHSPCQQRSPVVLISALKCQGCCLDPDPDGVALDLILGIYILLETILILKIIFLALTIG